MGALQTSTSAETAAASDPKSLLAESDPRFWMALREQTTRAASFDEVLPLSTMRRKALRRRVPWPEGATPAPLKLAIVGGCSLFPFHDLLEHLLMAPASGGAFQANLFLGDYDNYTPEILEKDSPLYAFAPETVLLIPSFQRCRYQGRLADPADAQRDQANQHAAQLLDLCRTLQERSRAEVLLVNYPLPAYFDPGPYRGRTLGSDWSFRKQVNLELGWRAPSYVHICDLEFLSARRGTLASTDERGWFESKQPCSADLLVDLAREAAHLIGRLRQGPKKVAVLDLDNTLWGGVIGDDGLEGIVIGDTSPRGEAFKAFQQFLKTLLERGVLLAVCSKNDEDTARWSRSRNIPRWSLRRSDFVSFKANWAPKSDNIRDMARELSLGLDSFVFIDDNPAEIEIVRQFAPEVTGDPARPRPVVVRPRSLRRPPVRAAGHHRRGRRARRLYRAGRRNARRSKHLHGHGFLPGIAWHEVRHRGIPPGGRAAHLAIDQQSNQFNLTTRRRSEAEVQEVMNDPECLATPCGWKTASAIMD